MAELFWSVFNLEMKDLPEIVAFGYDYLAPSLVLFLLWFELLACTLLLCFYIIGLVGGLWHYFHNRKKPIRVYPPQKPTPFNRKV